jgi:pectate lyase
MKIRVRVPILQVLGLLALPLLEGCKAAGIPEGIGGADARGGIGGGPGAGPTATGGGGGGAADAASSGPADRGAGPPAGPPSSAPPLCGWAAVAGDGVATTTGGGTAAPVTVTTAEELLMYAADAQARVIRFSGTLDVPRLQVNSNKTILGVGPDATINGGIRIRGQNLGARVENVIVRNVKVNGRTSQVDEDAVQIYFAHHVWIDHCDISDGPDGNLDITHGADHVTVSWTRFSYSTAQAHRFSNLIGHTDGNEAEDRGRLRVTFHHNWWAERVIERMPRARWGLIHLFNNYFNSAGNNYCIRAGLNSTFLVENNHFDGVGTPHETEMAGTVLARGNVYNDTTGLQTSGGPGFPLPYTCPIEAASDVPAAVRAGAGPR